MRVELRRLAKEIKHKEELAENLRDKIASQTVRDRIQRIRFNCSCVWFGLRLVGIQTLLFLLESSLFVPDVSDSGGPRSNSKSHEELCSCR